MTLKRSLWEMISMNAEGGSGGGDPASPAADQKPDPAQVLFSGENKPADPAPKDEEKPGEKPADPPAGDWKEYAPDPAKSEAENAAAKAEHDKTKPADKKDDKAAELDKVPDDGKYELTMPEGVEVDTQLLDALSPRLKAKGYTRREAQELADEFIKVQTQQQEQRFEEWGKTVAKWADNAKADPELGGTNWDKTVANAQRAMNAVATPALKEYLQASGGGNHPELIRAFAKVGSMISEDNPPVGDGGGKGKPAEPAHLLFPNDAPKGN